MAHGALRRSWAFLLGDHEMKKRILKTSALFLFLFIAVSVWSAAITYTTMTHVAIKASLIDSTFIGSGSPSTGQFTQIGNTAPGAAAFSSLSLPYVTAGWPLCTDSFKAAGSVGCSYSSLVTSGVSATAITSTNPTSLAAVTVLKPPAACTWRIAASYNFEWGGGTNQQHVASAIWDGANAWLPAETGSSNGTTGGFAGQGASGYSSVTYPSSTGSVALNLYAQSTVTTNPPALSQTGLTLGSPIGAAIPFQLQAYGFCLN